MCLREEAPPSPAVLDLFVALLLRGLLCGFGNGHLVAGPSCKARDCKRQGYPLMGAQEWLQGARRPLEVLGEGISLSLVFLGCLQSFTGFSTVFRTHDMAQQEARPLARPQSGAKPHG